MKTSRCFLLKCFILLIIVGETLSDELCDPPCGPGEECDRATLTCVPKNSDSDLLQEDEAAVIKVCDPPCRKGFICKEGECVSACNPPCGPDENCDPVTLDCVPKAPKTGASTWQTEGETKPASSPALEAIQPFRGVYLEVTPPITFGSFGNLRADIHEKETGYYDYEYDETAEYKLTAKVLGGIRLAVYGIPNRSFHIGGFFMLRAGKGEMEADNVAAQYWGFDGKDDIKIISTGLAMKFGGLVANRVFVGGGCDVGMNLLTSDDWEEYADDDDIDEDKIIGLELFPRFNLDIMLFNLKGFKMSVPIIVGATITPVSGRTMLDDKYDTGYGVYEITVKAKSFNITPMMALGIALGL